MLNGHKIVFIISCMFMGFLSSMMMVLVAFRNYFCSINETSSQSNTRGVIIGILSISVFVSLCAVVGHIMKRDMINGLSVLMFGSFLGIYTALVASRPAFCDIREDDVQRNTRDITTMILLTISWVLMFIGVSVKEPIISEINEIEGVENV